MKNKFFRRAAVLTAALFSFTCMSATAYAQSNEPVAETEPPGVSPGVIQQPAAVPMPPVLPRHMQRADPGPEVHPADEIIGDQSGATRKRLTVPQQIPLGQGTGAVQTVPDAVLIHDLVVAAASGLLQKRDGGSRVVRLRADGNDFHLTSKSELTLRLYMAGTQCSDP